MPQWKIFCLIVFGGIFFLGLIPVPGEDHWFMGIGLTGFILTLMIKDKK